MPSAQREVDAVVVGAGFAGLYMLHRLRGLGALRAGVRGRRRASAAPGTGTAIPARAATSRARTIPTRSPTSSSRSGTGPSATPPSRRSCATSTTSPTASTCARDIQLDTRVTAAIYDEAAGRWTVDAPTAATRSRRATASWPPAACRSPQGRRHSRARELRGPMLPHRPLAARGRRLHRQAGGA